MKRIGVMRILLLIGCFLVSSHSIAQTTTRNYLTISSDIANPERGWYNDYYNFDSYLTGSFYPLDSATLAQRRLDDNVTLILRMFYLHQFLSEDAVSDEYIVKMQADFNTARAAGVKCIIRFSYSDSQNASTWDATPDKVFSHIQSLSDVLAKNADVIATVQAGFIGVWGEWYYTKNFAGAGYSVSDEDILNRRKVVLLLLDILPDNVQVQVRTPAIKQYVVDSDEPISDSTAYSGSIISRVAHHNDCFLANSSDYGTYENLDVDLAYMAQDTRYSISGGETCDASNSCSDCDAGMPRMNLLHWTFLNSDYNTAVYRKWEEQGCLDSVTMKLGYRLSLDSTFVPNIVSAGDTIGVKCFIENTGFAAPSQNKNVLFFLKDNDGNIVEVENINSQNVDIRYWLPGKITLATKIVINEVLSDDNYQIGIAFQDKNEVLAQNSAYSIHLANLDIWDNANGINWLNQFIAVGNVAPLEEIQYPTDLSAELIDETHVSLSWNDNADNETAYQVYRKDNIIDNWELIEELSDNVNSYTDNTVCSGNRYTYAVRAINEQRTSEWSNTVMIKNGHIDSKIDLTFNTHIYPNPLFGSILNISIDNETISCVSVYDLSGHLKYRENTNSSILQLNNLNLDSGIYLLSIRLDNGKMISQKLLVN